MKQPISNKSFEKNLWNFFHKRISNTKFNLVVEIHREIFEEKIQKLIKSYKAKPFRKGGKNYYSSAYTFVLGDSYPVYKLGYRLEDDKIIIKFMYRYPNMHKFKRISQLIINLK